MLNTFNDRFKQSTKDAAARATPEGFKHTAPGANQGALEHGILSLDVERKRRLTNAAWALAMIRGGNSNPMRGYSNQSLQAAQQFLGSQGFTLGNQITSQDIDRLVSNIELQDDVKDFRHKQYEVARLSTERKRMKGGPFRQPDPDPLTRFRSMSFGPTRRGAYS